MSETIASAPVVVSENHRGRYQQDVRVGEHLLIADEPVSVGGGDAGPAPFDYLLAALGACTSMTVRMYAERKEWPLTEVSVALSLEAGPGGEQRIVRRITLAGELSAGQRSRLLEIANKCPLHRALSNPLAIDSSLVEAD
ncbi:OsmC family protein [Rhodocyclus purpureus]|uniref:OsmC family protein n=1 Tax=Rhodocyclus purpureus TaxID=1067 RepID=UPI0019149B13|nr:OsmC family protein [Rhodocyclus purpureus]MBK5915072.1 osmotically inducible protein OsmC [Rhodocyclus purpureus]